MNIVCLDMEVLLVPEIWIAFAEGQASRNWRLLEGRLRQANELQAWYILREHGLGLKEIQRM